MWQRGYSLSRKVICRGGTNVLPRICKNVGLAVDQVHTSPKGLQKKKKKITLSYLETGIENIKYFACMQYYWNSQGVVVYADYMR